MYLIINTSQSICDFIIYKDGTKIIHKWEAGRTLARDIFIYIEKILGEQNETLNNIKGIGVFEGPGSFTGLRIGLTVMNTLADSLQIPVVGVRGESWIDDAISKLDNKIDQKIVLPFYGSEANITVSKK